ncbi:hypothetical protein HSB1_15040 [Halogranum salarium B-1]|uniref:Uncharacterized protein n=1 Tax=Halogranum salarium B-1 TaxID=1210908 RepID=J3JHD9_9EURY|nr:hypothetical protein HSB1_15040 [Halogranum salarium B-1]
MLHESVSHGNGEARPSRRSVRSRGHGGLPSSRRDGFTARTARVEAAEAVVCH